MKRIVTLMMSCMLGALVGGSSLAQETKGARPEPSAEQKAVMDAWMKAAAPGAPHKALDALVGNWTAKITTWEKPGAEPQVATGTASSKWILGQRFVQESFKAQLAGMQYEGVGFTGFDNFKKKYTATWMDTMGTATMHLSGSFDATGQVLTMSGEIDDVVTGKRVKIRTVTTLVSPQEHRYELYGPDAGGAEFKSTEIVFTRKAPVGLGTRP